MALLADRVKESTTTTGTGTVSLAGAPAGFQSFNTAFANASLVYYVIQGGAEWEIGIGTVGTGTLARTTVLQSSNADALVPFSAGVKDVFCSYVADRAVTTVDAATLTNKTIDDYTNNIAANSTHFRVKANETLAKGDVVKAAGFTPGEAAIQVVKTTAASDVVLGIVEQALNTGEFGTAVLIGELFNVNTNGLSVGATLYSNGAGGWTTTKPSSGTYQSLGWVVRANTSNGVVAVNIVNPQYVEASTNTANTLVLRDGSGNFSAGTITATLSGTATQVSQALTAGTYLTSGGTYDGSTARTFAVDATSTNTASKVVVRDASGNFAAGTITASLSGNATTATTADKVANALTGGSYITSTGTFDGSAARTFAVDATSTNTASKVVARDASGNFAAGTITAALSGNATTATTADKVANALTAGSYLTTTGTFDGSAARTFAVDATDANTASKVVARDGSGNFSAGTITAALTGNASTATALQTARNINGVSFDGTANITVTAAAGTLTGTTLASNVVSSSLTSVGTLSNLTVTNPITGSVTGSSGSTTGNAATATALQTARNINGVSFNGTADITVTAAAGTLTGTTLASNVVSSSLTSVGTLSSLTVSGDLTVDTSTLKVDSSNNRVGIGTATPSNALNVSGSGYLVAVNGGGTSRIAQTFGNTGGTFDIGIESSAGGALFTGGSAYASCIGSSNATALQFGTNGTIRATIDTAGNLGLGVTPSAWANARALEVQFAGNALWGFNAAEFNVLQNTVYSSGAFRYGSTGAASRYEQNTGAHRWYTAPSGTAGNAITFTQALTLTANGDVGIGPDSTSPAEALQISRATDPKIRFLDVGNVDAKIGIVGSTALGFECNGSERARITSGGYFKASNDGTYYGSTGTYHELRTDAAEYAVYISNKTSTSGNAYGAHIIYPSVAPNGTGNPFLYCQDSAALRAAIRSNGGLANYQSNNADLSDARTKTDITPIVSMWDKVSALEIVTYKYTDQTHDDVNVGVIAQQVETVEPAWVDADGFGETPADGIPLKTVYTKDITFAAIRALQEAMARIETLEARVAALGV